MTCSDGVDNGSDEVRYVHKSLGRQKSVETAVYHC